MKFHHQHHQQQHQHHGRCSIIVMLLLLLIHLSYWIQNVSSFSLYPMVSKIAVQQHRQQQRQQRQQQHTSLFLASSSSSSSSSSLPNDDSPIMEAISSLADYHEGTWKSIDGARSFTIGPDTAAGILGRKVSLSYETSMTVRLDPSNRKFILQEDMKINNDDMISTSSRSVILNDCNCDIDSVDGSYSLDEIKSSLTTTTTGTETEQNLKNMFLPSEISGTDKESSFLIEHCIAASENRRVRCFVMYGTDQTLQRIVICNEERKEIKKNSSNNKKKKKVDSPGTLKDKLESSGYGNKVSTAEMLEMESDIDRLVNMISSRIVDPNKEEEGSSTSNSDVNEPIDVEVEPVISPNAANGDSTASGITSNDDDDDDNINDRMERLGQSLANNEKSDNESGFSTKLIPHDATLLEVSSGVWLGDVMIREIPNVDIAPRKESSKGFGSTSSPSSSSSKKNKKSSTATSTSSTFGEWTQGVQKVAWRVMWNFGDEIRQLIDLGKALGVQVTPYLPRSLAGSVCVNEDFVRQMKKSDKMAYISWSGDVVSFVTGPYIIQVPQYVNFDDDGGTSLLKPFYTEFALFQATESENKDSNDEDDNTDDDTTTTVKELLDDIESKSIEELLLLEEEAMKNLPQLICSKISRIYNYQGKLKQGSTSFFQLKRFGTEEDHNNDDDDD